SRTRSLGRCQPHQNFHSLLVRTALPTPWIRLPTCPPTSPVLPQSSATLPQGSALPPSALEPPFPTQVAHGSRDARGLHPRRRAHSCTQLPLEAEWYGARFLAQSAASRAR